MITNEFNREYLLQEAKSADSARQIEMLYQRALRDLAEAHALWPTLTQDASPIKLLVHAQDIVMELQGYLNYTDGGETAVTLCRLYDFIQFSIVQITRGCLAGDAQKISDLIEILTTISDAWSKLANRERNTNSSALAA